jgi:predicted kinase
MGAPVLAHDWAMSGLRPFTHLQQALDSMNPPGHRNVGWSLLSALGRAHLRRGIPVVLDGVARAPEVGHLRNLATEEGCQLFIVHATCHDEALHRARVLGRQRHIPNWYELDWPDVLRARTTWEPPPQVDVALDGSNDLTANVDSLLERLGPRRGDG